MVFLHFNDGGTVLLNEMKLDRLENYNFEEIKNLEEENRTIRNKLEELERGEINEEMGVSYMLYKGKLDRNENIMNAYFNYRLEKILDGNTQSVILSEREKSIKEKYDRAEKTYLSHYSDIICDQMPISIYIRFYTEEDCGIIFDEQPIHLKKNRIYCLKKKLVNHLIELKKIKIID